MALRQANYPMITNSAGAQTNPTTATVMADTGAITEALAGGTGGGGPYEVLVVAYASAAAVMQIEHRDKTNATATDTVIFGVPAGATVTIPLRFELLRDNVNGERVRVMMQTNLTGTAAATIQAQRIV